MVTEQSYHLFVLRYASFAADCFMPSVPPGKQIENAYTCVREVGQGTLSLVGCGVKPHEGFSLQQHAGKTNGRGKPLPINIGRSCEVISAGMIKLTISADVGRHHE